MKQFILSLMLTITAMLVFSFHSFAQDIPVEEDGEANGWFYQDYIFYSGPFFNTTATFNYASQRKDVTGISPNYN